MKKQTAVSLASLVIGCLLVLNTWLLVTSANTCEAKCDGFTLECEAPAGGSCDAEDGMGCHQFPGEGEGCFKDCNDGENAQCLE